MSQGTAAATEERLLDQLDQRIVVLDGSMGALILQRGPTEEDYRGERFCDHSIDLKNSTDVLCLTQPQMIEEIHLRIPRRGRGHY